MMVWSAIWRVEALALQLLALLDANDVCHVMRVDKRSRKCILHVLKTYRTRSARLGLALWHGRHVELEFQSYYQELETRQIARSRVQDPRVPPRVVSAWVECGKVPGGAVVVRPEWLPKLTEHGVLMRFAVNSTQKPMMTNVAQMQRRIYTVVTLRIVQDDGENREEAIVLRRMTYLKEFGEWQAPLSSQEKRHYDSHGALCRYDLVSIDGNVVLELDVPSGADSAVDYYLVKGAVVTIPKDELWAYVFHSIRPPQALPMLSNPRAKCLAVLGFTRLDGSTVLNSQVQGHISIEQGGNDSNSTPGSTDGGSERAQTGIEHFEIVTFQAAVDTAPSLQLPTEPGYLWLSLVDPPSSSPSLSSRQRFYVASMLHSGAQRRGISLVLDAEWLPGVLVSYPTPISRQRRCLKGKLHISIDPTTHAIHELSVVAQHLSAERLRPYAAHIESASRFPTANDDF
ncbi:hypothetical protein Poli38472_012754 [Pythium oligandrum]|uniref:Uncharacterized protein n=1 Tax=Pythium oligandrum TaxID=41045 RepID=A0A8K1CEJ5_PYTOL|nr:hypothetical protein Poli38472_012754 [Pythium oligandrum]|eukprot:TMW61563.1 hypothetical protein Poli38472_012754 [Pythium oligandrum]